MTSTTFTVRVDSVAKERLESLSKSTGRSRSFLAAEAIEQYLDVNEWQVAGVKAAIKSIDERGGAAHEDVKAWIASWGGDHELSRPKLKRS
jgi:RHH-type rel operon transcriptional repressor/antitoxin RelB